MYSENKRELMANGFTTIPNVFSYTEVERLLEAINTADAANETFRRTADLFAIRKFLNEIPAAVPLIFNDNVRAIIREIFGVNYFAIKSIYFDKPPASNWYVSRHQDLTISVNRKADIPGFSHWTVKHEQYAVQPPVEYLENIFTLRIHLDDTDVGNGALRVIPGSDSQGIVRPETINGPISEIICNVPKGAVMIMKPLLMHSSSRSSSGRRRRVIHIEFSNKELPEGMLWAEQVVVAD